MHRRKYKSGTGWCFWRWTEVETGYITRLHVIKTPWFAICLHWLNSPDPDPYLHDHPVSFLSIVLRGCYREIRYRYGFKLGNIRSGNHAVRWFNFISYPRHGAGKMDAHSIIHVLPGTLTLCLMGPKRWNWGYYRSQGWIRWQDYYDLPKDLR